MNAAVQPKPSTSRLVTLVQHDMTLPDRACAQACPLLYHDTHRQQTTRFPVERSISPLQKTQKEVLYQVSYPRQAESDQFRKGWKILAGSLF